MRSGNTGLNGKLRNIGNTGYYWPSTSVIDEDDDEAIDYSYDLSFNTTTTFTTGNSSGSRNSAFSLRCLSTVLDR